MTSRAIKGWGRVRPLREEGRGQVTLMRGRRMEVSPSMEMPDTPPPPRLSQFTMERSRRGMVMRKGAEARAAVTEALEERGTLTPPAPRIFTLTVRASTVWLGRRSLCWVGAGTRAL